MQPANSLLLGDCLQRMDEIEAGSIDAILTDLPYGTTSNKWDSIIPLDQLWSAWKRICKPGAPIILFTQQPFTTIVAASNLRQLKSEWIWIKPQGTGFLNANRYPLKSHENILVFCDRTPAYHPQMSTGHKPYVVKRDKGNRQTPNYRKFRESATVNTDGTRYPTTVLSYKPDRGLHPTQKPVALIEYLIRTYTDPGALILDCCAGSGSTAIAALNTGRRYVCIERDPGYYAIATQRIEDHRRSCHAEPHDHAASPDVQPSSQTTDIVLSTHPSPSETITGADQHHHVDTITPGLSCGS